MIWFIHWWFSFLDKRWLRPSHCLNIFRLSARSSICCVKKDTIVSKTQYILCNGPSLMAIAISSQALDNRIHSRGLRTFISNFNHLEDDLWHPHMRQVKTCQNHPGHSWTILMSYWYFHSVRLESCPLDSRTGFLVLWIAWLCCQLAVSCCQAASVDRLAASMKADWMTRVMKKKILCMLMSHEELWRVIYTAFVILAHSLSKVNITASASDQRRGR